MIPQHEWTWTDVLPALIGFGGVIVTLLVNAGLSRKQDRRQLDEKRKALRIALTEELRVSLNSYKEAIKTVEVAQLDQTTSLLVPTRCFTFVYERLIDQIGLLTPHEVEKVMNAYLMIQQMAETIRLLPGTTLKSPEWLNVADTDFRHFKQLTQNMVEIVDTAVAALSR